MSVDPKLEEAVRDLEHVRESIRRLKDQEAEIVECIASLMGRGERVVIEGVGAVEVKRGKDRTEWDRRALVRAVLDSRLPVDESTGELSPWDSGMAEVNDEKLSCSPDLSRVLHVWNLGAPRITALKERGIPADEFCASSPGRLSVVIS